MKMQAAERFAFDVFLSHNRTDKPWVRGFYGLLQRNNLRVFFDEVSIDYGEDTVKALDRALDTSKHILLVITPSSMASHWVASEAAVSIYSDPSAAEKKLIPLLLEPTSAADIPLTIRRLNTVDLTDPKTRNASLTKLLRQLGVPAGDTLALPDWPWTHEVSLNAANPDKDGSEARAADPRRKVLWQFAYAFLRLDQLPSGGWAKSLPAWLEALLEGPDDVVASADTRTKGGTDLTSRAFLTYLRFLRRLNLDKPRAGDRPWQIACAVHDNIGDKIGWDGGVGVGRPGRVAHHIRHTLMGLLTFLYIYECTRRFPENISSVEGYLRNHLLEWKIDKSHPFACFCILAKVREKLAEIDFAPVWSPEPLLEVIDIVLPEMCEILVRLGKVRAGSPWHLPTIGERLSVQAVRGFLANGTVQLSNVSSAFSQGERSDVQHR